MENSILKRNVISYFSMNLNLAPVSVWSVTEGSIQVNITLKSRATYPNDRIIVSCIDDYTARSFIT